MEDVFCTELRSVMVLRIKILMVLNYVYSRI